MPDTGDVVLQTDQAVALLRQSCGDCHADGAQEGGFAIDELLQSPTDPAHRDPWHRVLKNIRADLMPPAEAEALPTQSRRDLTRWISRDPLGLSEQLPDPGKLTLRRLNRVEYRNTIKDLMGVDFDTDIEFPADDSGHGFDTIADVLSLSPLLMEKYIAAAQTIVSQAVPQVTWVTPSHDLWPDRFRLSSSADLSPPLDPPAKSFDGRVTLYRSHRIAGVIPVGLSGQYRVVVHARVDGGFEFGPGRGDVRVRFDDEVVDERLISWADSKSIPIQWTGELKAGDHSLQVDVTALVDEAEKNGHLDLIIGRVELIGPLGPDMQVHPRNYQRFFGDQPVPTDPVSRRNHARDLVQRFADKAYRRPASERSIDALMRLIDTDLNDPEVTFEQSLSKAFIAVLASPRFLFRHETTLQGDQLLTTPRIDEYSLASRLSYFLWSTMPDQELIDLAAQGRLRDQWTQQIDRMLADPRSKQLTENFVGQWLRLRDVETLPIDPLSAMGLAKQYETLRDELIGIYRERRRISELKKSADQDQVAYQAYDEPEYREQRMAELKKQLGELNEIRDRFDGRLRRDMKRQTEALFEYVLKSDRSVLELIDNDYEFLNKRLVEFYQIDLPGLDVESLAGDELHRVDLPAGSHRGGILRQPSFLMLTSNPTRTSPVKRGLFILGNILGTPAPPAPAAVPELEASAEAMAGQTPTLREVLERHRSDALCASCHRRFDPLGLALENFDALGRYRTQEDGSPIDPVGELITGEAFQDSDELLRVITQSRREDFYRCLTEKLLTYSLGRGVEYHDEPVIDAMVGQMTRSPQPPTLRQMIHAVVGSVPFQRTRGDSFQQTTMAR